MTWGEQANKAIGTVLDEFQANGGDILRLTDEDKATLKKKIDEAYPFGERNNFPYKAWLNARRLAFISLGISYKGRWKSGTDNPVEGQLGLKF